MGRITARKSSFSLPPVLTLLVLLCFTPGGLEAAGFSAASRCNPIAVDTCALPFPSDVFRNTVGRYNYSNTILDRRTTGSVRQLAPARLQFPSSFMPSEILNRSTGFSALGPVLFELNEWPFTDIPEDGEGVLHVYNMKTGERVPMIVSLNKAAQAKLSPGRGRPVVSAWPRTRFEFGERYIAVLFQSGFNDVVGLNGNDLFQPTEGVTKALNGEAGWILNYTYTAPVNSLRELGIPFDNILSFTWFTVKDEEEVTQPMQDMVATALEYPNYATELEVAKTMGDPDYELVALKGQLSMVNFRDEDGGVYPPYAPIQDLSRRRVEFIMSLPKWEQDSPVPVAVFGHGLGNFKEFTHDGFIMGDRLGMATIAIDHPNHGSRVTTFDVLKEPHISMAVSTPLTIMQLLGMFVQATVDQNVVIHTTKHGLPELLASWSNPEYPNVPKLDSDRVMFDGMSLGGMLGMGIGATAPDLQGVYLVNGTGSLMQAFTESTFWPSFTSHVVPLNMNGAEMMFVVGMMQHYLDIADGNNFAQYYRNPPDGRSERPLGMHYSLGDGSFPNSSSLATAKLVDLPLLKEVIEPVPDLRFGETGADDFENGYGIVQSGFGLELANQSLESLKELDLDNKFGQLDDTILTGLIGVDLSSIPGGSDTTGYLANLIGVGDAQSIDDLLDQVYSGELDDFLTHFNRGSEAALHHAIDWRCQLFSLSADLCANAKQLASDDVKNGVTNGLPDLGGGGDVVDDTVDQITDVIDTGLSNIQVTEGSGGSFSWVNLVVLGLILIWYQSAATPVVRANAVSRRSR
ncbi:hypothetical protein [Ketobacter sp.]